MIFIALAVCFILYLPALNNKFIVDDLAILDECEQKNIEKPKSKLKQWYMLYTGKGYWDECSKDLHLMVLISHFAVALMIYYAFGQNTISFFASILFAVHPGNTENSLTMAAKQYTSTALFILLCWMIPQFAPLYICRPLIAISGTFAPFLYLLKPGFEILAIVGVFKLYLVVKEVFKPETNGKLDGVKNNKYQRGLGWKKIIVGLKFYGYYISNSISGMKNVFYQSYMNDYCDSEEGIKKGQRVDMYFFIGVFTLILLACLIIILPHSMVTLGLAWATVNILMWCNFIGTGQQYIATRYHYLPNIGLCLMLSALLPVWSVVLLIGWYAREIPNLIRAYYDPFWQFEYQLLNEPEFWMSWNQRGILDYHRGNFKAAISSFKTALKFKPDEFKATFNISSAELARGEFGLSTEWFKKAAECKCYGQEHRKAEVLQQRQELIKFIVGEIKRTGKPPALRTVDIPVLA